jgi:hypothetical protein
MQVMNSDLGFNLMFGTNVSKVFLQHVIEALRPYPLGEFRDVLSRAAYRTQSIHAGLLSNIGMMVANPAYDSNTTNINVLNRASYHGTVIWFIIRPSR